MTSLKFISYQQELLEKAHYFIVNMTWLAMVLLAFSDFWEVLHVRPHVYMFHGLPSQ